MDSWGIEQRYFRYDSAGDHHVGRTLSGLPVHDAKFSTVGPHFNSSNPIVDQYAKMFFPHSPIEMRHVCHWFLASLVYHFDYLNDKLAANHTIRSGILFQDPSVVPELKPLIKLNWGLMPSQVSATGYIFF
jgi:hypothetical protein